MRIIVSEAYREEFEVLISKYHKFCDALIDLVVDNLPIEKLLTYCRRKQPDVMPSLTGTVSSSDVMKEIINKCSITNTASLKDVIQHYRITDEEKIIEDYQRSLDEYLSKLRTRYLLGSKDMFNAEIIIFILDWTPDEASFLNIRRLLYKAFHHLNKNIIVQDIGKKILHVLL